MNLNENYQYLLFTNQLHKNVPTPLPQSEQPFRFNALCRGFWHNFRHRGAIIYKRVNGTVY